MTQEEKNSVSHRGKALRDLGAEFEKVLIWIRQRLP
jgi:XTP/dITP diphosphohydrolase